MYIILYGGSCLMRTQTLLRYVKLWLSWCVKQAYFNQTTTGLRKKYQASKDVLSVICID